MFIKTGYFHLTYVFAVIVVIMVLDLESTCPGFKTAGWIQG